MAEIKEPVSQPEQVAMQPAAPAAAEQPEKVEYGGAETGGGPEKKKKKMSPKKRKKLIGWLIFAIVAAAAVFLLIKFLGGGKKNETQVITNTVQYGSITSTVEGSGLTKAKNSQAITLTTAGTVQEVYVAEGDHVTVGTPLFTVNSPAARTAVQTAQNQVNGYQKQLTALQKDIAGLNFAAPFAGKLTDTATFQKGDTISKGDKIGTLADDTKLRLQQYYSYAYKGEIRAGQTVSVSIPALMSSVTGRVEAVHMVSRITAEGSKLFEADIVLANPGTLTADMTASATIAVNGETVYPYEAGKLANYRTKALTATVGGTVISSSLVDYMSVSAGQVLVRIDGEDSQNEIFTIQQQLTSAQSDLDKAQKNLDNMSAVAPIDGTVMGLSIAPGDELTGTATTVITIADTSTMLIDATVDERNISYVKAGMPVTITDWSNNTYTGTVDKISMTSKVDNGVASYPMTISVDNAAGTVVNGSNVNYSLVASQNDNCLILPIQCVKYVQMEDGSTNTVVFVQADSKPDAAIDLPTWPDDVPSDGFYAVPVETGISDDNNIEIKSGADEGTTVFTAKQVTNSWG
jgi:hypothetical protein